MPEFAKNAAYIWACYGIGALMILTVIAQTVLAARAARRGLAALEADAGEEA